MSWETEKGLQTLAQAILKNGEADREFQEKENEKRRDFEREENEKQRQHWKKKGKTAAEVMSFRETMDKE